MVASSGCSARIGRCWRPADACDAAEVQADEASLGGLVVDRCTANPSSGQTTGNEELIRSLLGIATACLTTRERSLLVEFGFAVTFATEELHLA